jgi:hypothetical protein
MASRTEHRVRLVVNWTLAVLTVPGALFVFLFGIAAAMGTDRCAYEDCPRMGPPAPVLTLCRSSRNGVSPKISRSIRCQG